MLVVPVDTDLHHHHGCTALGGPWPSQANVAVASDLYAGHPPANFFNQVSLRLRWPPGFVHNIFLGNSFSSIRTTWPSHPSLLDFITLYLVHCKDLLILCCISSAITLPRMLNHLIQNLDVDNRKKCPCERHEGIDEMKYGFTPN